MTLQKTRFSIQAHLTNINVQPALSEFYSACANEVTSSTKTTRKAKYVRWSWSCADEFDTFHFWRKAGHSAMEMLK